MKRVTGFTAETIINPITGVVDFEELTKTRQVAEAAKMTTEDLLETLVRYGQELKPETISVIKLEIIDRIADL